MCAEARHWALLAAAGVGRRMGAVRPKQYLEVAGRTVLEHSLTALLSHSSICGAVVCLAADDRYWATLSFPSDKPIATVVGGTERCHSVLNGLEHLSLHAGPADWVLVHDAARPCLQASDLQRLIDEASDDVVGGLLAVPVRDTLKRSNRDGRAAATVDRAGLWQAQTPQMFRLHALRGALQESLRAGVEVTDEASAMERLGHLPRLVEGHVGNIKITHPDDIPLAEFWLSARGGRQPGSEREQRDNTR